MRSILMAASILFSVTTVYASPGDQIAKCATAQWQALDLKETDTSFEVDYRNSGEPYRLQQFAKTAAGFSNFKYVYSLHLSVEKKQLPQAPCVSRQRDPNTILMGCFDSDAMPRKATLTLFDENGQQVDKSDAHGALFVDRITTEYIGKTVVAIRVRMSFNNVPLEVNYNPFTKICQF